MRCIKWSDSVNRIWSRRLAFTKQELTGHLRALIGDKAASDEAYEKLLVLFKWLVGSEPPGDYAWFFDLETRIFLVSFDKDTYFKKGGKEFHEKVMKEMNRRGWPYVSYWGATYWVGYFPHWKEVQVEEPIQVKAKVIETKTIETKEIEEEQEIPQAEVPKREFKARVTRQRKGVKPMVEIDPDIIEDLTD